MLLVFMINIWLFYPFRPSDVIYEAAEYEIL